MSGRFPPLARDALTPEQQAYAAAHAGRETGPYQVFLRNPDMHAKLQPVRQRLRAQLAIPQALIELAVLQVARHWDCPAMFEAHRPLALQAGLDAQVIEATAAELSGEAAALAGFVEALLRSGRVADAAFDAAREAFGEAALVDLLALIGFYSAVALALNLDERGGV